MVLAIDDKEVTMEEVSIYAIREVLNGVEESLKTALKEAAFYGSGSSKIGYISNALEEVQKAIRILLKLG